MGGRGGVCFGGANYKNGRVNERVEARQKRVEKKKEEKPSEAESCQWQMQCLTDCVPEIQQDTAECEEGKMASSLEVKSSLQS